jgi:hypothetical protein
MALRIKTSPLFWNNKGKCCARASIAQFTQFGKLIALTDDSRKVDDETFTRGRRAAAARDVSYAVFEDTFYPWLQSAFHPSFRCIVRHRSPRGWYSGLSCGQEIAPAHALHLVMQWDDPRVPKVPFKHEERHR